MKHIFLFLILISNFFSSYVFAKTYTKNEYKFPIQDSYWATLATALNGTNIQYDTFQVNVRPSRATVPRLENRHRVPVNFFIGKNKYAPVAFVIAGLGASASSGNAVYLAEQLYNIGYNVITLPNPVSWNYALGVSASGAPGYLPLDTPEYYRFMELVTRIAQNKYNLEPSSYNITGYSYGGLLTAFLKAHDLETRTFNFKKTLIINPGIDLKYGMKKLDSFYDIGRYWSLGAKVALNGIILKSGLQLTRIDELTDLIIQDKINSMPYLSMNQKIWLIGESFKIDLTALVATSQQVQDQGLLKSKGIKDRMAEAKKISFAQYIEKVVIPRNHINLSFDDTLASGSLYNVLKKISSDPGVYMQEAQDDFLLKNGDSEFFSKELGDRLMLYPYGGHVGNLRYKVNKNDLAAIFRDR